MPPQQQLKFEASAVRACAQKVPGCRELPVANETVLSFLTGLHEINTATNDKQKRASLARVNVYLQTGTIGTNRFLGDQLREVFDRNVATMQALEAILHKPPQLTEIKRIHMPGDGGDGDLSSQMELAEVGVCILMAERENIQAQLKILEETSGGGSKAAGDGLPADDDSAEGMDFEFRLPEDVMQQAEQCLRDIQMLNKHISCVTSNGRGVVFLYGNGGVAYTPNIPKPLYQKLKALRTNPKASRPSYVALGSRERYFCSFFDGTRDWRGPKALDRVLNATNNSSNKGGRSTQVVQRAHPPAPRSVAFGSTYDTFCVVFEDGSWEYQGKSIPRELVEKLKSRDNKLDLVCVTLGPKGEWFLRAGNGRMWWGGISSELDELIQNLLTEDRYLNFLDFGEDGTFFLTYD